MPHLSLTWQHLVFMDAKKPSVSPEIRPGGSLLQLFSKQADEEPRPASCPAISIRLLFQSASVVMLRPARKAEKPPRHISAGRKSARRSLVQSWLWVSSELSASGTSGAECSAPPATDSSPPDNALHLICKTHSTYIPPDVGQICALAHLSPSLRSAQLQWPSSNVRRFCLQTRPTQPGDTRTYGTSVRDEIRRGPYFSLQRAGYGCNSLARPQYSWFPFG